MLIDLLSVCVYFYYFLQLKNIKQKHCLTGNVNGDNKYFLNAFKNNKNNL
nr:MAG TPA: hypothetical protein [Caudoviricetes sp.]